MPVVVHSGGVERTDVVQNVVQTKDDVLQTVNTPITAPMQRFLAWVAFRPRTEAEAMEAWQTHCPRSTVWENALGDGLIDLDPPMAALGTARVRLTSRGQEVLDGCAA